MADLRPIENGLSFGPLLHGLRRGGSALLDLVLPPRCLSCGCQTGSHGGLCTGCWRSVRFISSPQCAQCGYPFELDFGAGARCGGCLSSTPCFDRARAAVAYDDRIARLLITFKHGDRTDLAPGLSRWMARVGSELLDSTDLIMPVPLHRRRLLDRRYNQSVLLAKSLASESGKPLSADILIRKRHTPTQGHLSPSARRRNVEGAFRTDPTRKDDIAGRRVLLIDDVMTTGATVNAIARRLKRDGAGAVDVLTFARVVRETTPA
ncbi:MAG: ComF family protein [Alphaproteobacteria bacterium]|nr:ComF family protein [Alphaproteobacteria bacterium]